MMTETPHLVRIGWFNGNLEETVKKFKSDFSKAPGLLPNLTRFVAYEPNPINYLVFISHDSQKKFDDEQDYNLGLTIVSRIPSYNERILSDFIAKTGIPNLREPPSPELRRLFGFINYAFPVFERVGLETALTILKDAVKSK